MAKALSTTHRGDMKRVIRGIRLFFDRAQIYPRGHVFLDKVVLAHVSKGLKVAEAVMCLVDSEFAEEAFGLSRTLVEVAFNLRFITNRYSERRAQRFVHYYARWKMEQIRRAVKHFKGGKDNKGRSQPKYTKAELRKQVPDYRKLVKMALKFPDRNSWTRTHNWKASTGGAWKMAVEPDAYERIDGEPVKWEFDYDWIYFWTSQYVHATVACMDSHSVVPREAFSIHIAPERAAHTAGLAVFNTGLYLHKILVMAFRAIKHDFPENLSKRLGAVLTSMSDEELKDIA